MFSCWRTPRGVWIYDAKDGEPLGGAQIVGKNSDTFD